MSFAKLYETEVGQILVMKDEGDDGPKITVHFEPENLGICNVNFNWCDDKEEVQWEKCDEAFDLMTEEKCTAMIKSTLSEINL